MGISARSPQFPHFRQGKPPGFPAQEGRSRCREPGRIDCYYADRPVCRPGQASSDLTIAPTTCTGNSTTEDYRYENSLERRRYSYSRRIRDHRTGFSPAFGPRTDRTDRYRRRRHSARRVWPLLYALQCAVRISRSALFGIPRNNIGDHAPAARCNGPCGHAAVTVVRRAK
jgi:hypothetical protein